ncbi:unnamed protein product [Rotaria sordida]|uniref:Uncharacterized protein n=1 Tax=Rotaria sordida TaxID=392033 RepID=A0A814A5C9_9BILA|nr:unnamed protein product [Rotaria sordida]CAF3502107.1 unnamed protein product [Rotaria sordida]
MANVLHLSKLSRGHVELSENGSRLEIFADSNENPLIRTSGTNQLPHIPKTYSTKRGPLVLFAETGFIKHSRSKAHRDKRMLHHDLNSPSLISPPPLKLGELKRSILAYGGTPENQLLDGVVDEDGTYINMKLSSKKRPHPSKYAGISPNIAIKRRYMIASSEDRKRDLDSLLELEYSISRGQRYSMMKTHILSDEISLLPPIYRNPDIVQHSPSFLADTYRFFKIDNSVSLNDYDNTDQVNSEIQNTLEIVDSKGSYLSYETLEQSEKEKILADLLIQTALHNIAEQQNIEIFEDALNRVRDSDITQSFSTMDIPSFVDESSLTAFPSDATNNNQNFKSPQTSTDSPAQQHYMFGKMQGTKWARNRPSHSNTLPTKSKHQTNNTEQQNDTTTSDEFNTEYTQTASDFVHSKLIRASRMLAPISTSAHQEPSIIRNQQHTTTKLSTKLRKFHDIDSNQHKIKTKPRRKYEDQRQLQHFLSPAQSQQDKLTETNQLIEKEQSLTNSLHRQRSSKSSKLNTSRQGTGKTFATGRCVTSPFSIHEEAERLLAIDSCREDDDDDDDANESVRTSIVDAAEDALVRNVSQSPGTKTDEEHDQHVHPSEMNITDNSIMPPEVNLQRSAYTHPSHGTVKSKNSSVVPPGALLIAPDGEVLFVGGQSVHQDNDYDDYLSKQEPFGHQPSTTSLVIGNNDQQGISLAPCVPMVLGTKRERLPDETVIRRTLNLTGGDFNSQIGLQSWSYEVPLERRRIVTQSYTLIPPPPPIGLSAFTGRKHHHQKRIAQEIHDHAMLHSTLSMHSEAIQQQPQQRTTIHSNNKTRSVLESQSPLFTFTSWAYQRPPTPPIVKRPYLYKPDYRPSGIHGHKHPLGDTETLIRRTINIHAGDIDASLSFTIWVYDMWINDLIKSGADPNYIKQVKSLFDLFKQRRLSNVDLQDKEFLTALANHAQALARIILKRSDSGHHLAEDAQLVIIENIRNLKHLLDQRLASVSDDKYREILRETLQHVLMRGNLENLQITDEILMALMDYPIEAFEIYLDPDTGDEYIRIKSSFQTRKNKIKGKTTKKKTKTVIISEEISPDDFKRIIDKKTGEYVYRLRKSIAEQKGFMDLIDTNFDIITDKQTEY